MGWLLVRWPCCVGLGPRRHFLLLALACSNLLDLSLTLISVYREPAAPVQHSASSKRLPYRSRQPTSTSRGRRRVLAPLPHFCAQRMLEICDPPTSRAGISVDSRRLCGRNKASDIPPRQHLSCTYLSQALAHPQVTENRLPGRQSRTETTVKEQYDSVTDRFHAVEVWSPVS